MCFEERESFGKATFSEFASQSLPAASQAGGEILAVAVQNYDFPKVEKKEIENHAFT